MLLPSVLEPAVAARATEPWPLRRNVGPLRLRILVSGMIAAVPRQGGATWAVLNWVLGLRRLGHDVLFVESIPPECLEPAGTPLEYSENAHYFRQITRGFRLQMHSSLLVDGSERSIGVPFERVRDFGRRADILFNLSGLLRRDEILGDIPKRVYIDLDPAFTQLWYSVQGLDMRFDDHTHFASVGDAVGSPACMVPACGIDWLPVRPPVVLERWPFIQGAGTAFTTIAHWRGYGSIQHAATRFGQKAHSVRMFLRLPERTGEDFVLALSIHPDETADIRALDRNGWKRVDPRRVASSPARYRRFVQNSYAEIGIAKSGYVLARCGWFSDRSACYLASGRPVIAQDTGFSASIPTGLGLFRFEDESEFVTAVDALRRDYAANAREARRIAERFFDSDRVLRHLIERVA